MAPEGLSIDSSAVGFTGCEVLPTGGGVGGRRVTVRGGLVAPGRLDVDTLNDGLSSKMLPTGGAVVGSIVAGVLLTGGALVGFG